MFKGITGPLPCPIPARTPAPTAATSLLAASGLLLAFLFSVAAASPALAQDAQSNGYQGRVISNTLEHSAPRPKFVFTNTPPARETEEASPALAHAENSSDDFENNTPTAWWTYYGQSVNQIASLITQNNARLVDIQPESSSGTTFTVTMVSNTGAYAKTWWWYVGRTEAQVTSEWQANKARLVSLKAYDTGGGKIRFAVIMIANTGPDERNWYWYYGKSVSEISSLLETDKARLIAVDPYTTGGKTEYSAIMVDNTGANATAWWWYINVSPAALANLYSQNKARIFYLTNGSSGKLNAIMEDCSKGCSEWWYYFGLKGSAILDTAFQNGARLINAASYPGCGGTCFAGAMINNSNAITTRVGNLIRSSGTSGTEGLYLEKVSGPGPNGVLANLEDNVVFEPASTIKVVANLYSMHEVQSGAIKLTTPIKHYVDGPESCPVPTISGKEPLGTAIREMMWHSDNSRTAEITDHWGFTNLNKYAKSIGMTDTAFHEYVGCNGNPNMLTLDDAGTLYADVAKQDVLNAKNRGIFYSNMAGRAQFESEGYDWTSVWSTDIPNLIDKVAPAGTSAAQKQAYWNAMNVAYKAGNYVLCANDYCTNVDEDISIAGWFQIPFCTDSGTTYSEYVWGIMFANKPYDGWTSTTVTPTDKTFTKAKSELMREQIQAGMASCQGKSLEVMSYSPADLTFGGSTAPIKIGTTTASKTVQITNNQTTAVTGLSVSVFGDFKETDTCGSSLASGKSCTISVDFTPTAAGERTGAVVITDNGTGQPQTIELTGWGKS